MEDDAGSSGISVSDSQGSFQCSVKFDDGSKRDLLCLLHIQQKWEWRYCLL